MIDLLVAGGGPAGLATAIHAALAGLDVLVVEPRPGPIDKACGEGLMPGAVRAAEALGAPLTGQPLRGIRYLDGHHRAEASFRAGCGLGVRRTVLHAALAQRAAALGVPVVAGRVTTVTQDAGSVRAAGFTARYLAAADGLHSTVRRALALHRAPGPRRPPRYGLRRHFALPPWTDHVEVHWSPRAEAYVTPIGPRLVGVALLTGDRAPFDELLPRFPALGELLRGAEAGAVRGAGPLRQAASARVAGRVLLVGDAAGYLDALTGEGIALALACAPRLVECVRAGTPQRYERAWRETSRRYRLLTSSLLWLRHRPPAARRIVPDRGPAARALRHAGQPARLTRPRRSPPRQRIEQVERAALHGQRGQAAVGPRGVFLPGVPAHALAGRHADAHAVRSRHPAFARGDQEQLGAGGWMRTDHPAGRHAQAGEPHLARAGRDPGHGEPRAAVRSNLPLRAVVPEHPHRFPLTPVPAPAAGSSSPRRRQPCRRRTGRRRTWRGRRRRSAC